MSKTITIDDLIPFLKKGWVAMDSCKTWWWFNVKPNMADCGWCPMDYSYTVIDLDSCFFNIAPYQGDWKDSLRRVK